MTEPQATASIKKIRLVFTMIEISPYPTVKLIVRASKSILTCEHADYNKPESVPYVIELTLPIEIRPTYM